MTREDTLDLGQRYFVFSVFAALTVGSLLTILLIGITHSWIGAAIGVAANLAVVYVAARLYAKGLVDLAKYGLFGQAILCLLFVALALTMRNALENWLIAGVLASGVGFYASQFLSSHITVYLAEKRGERLDITSTGEVIVPAASFVSKDNKLVFRDDLKAGYKLLSFVTFAVGGLLLLLSAAAVVGGVVGLFVLPLGDWFGLLVVGALTHVVGMVLITTSSDTNFLATTQGYEGNHLTNSLTSLKMFLNLQLGLTALIVVVLLVRWIATA